MTAVETTAVETTVRWETVCAYDRLLPERGAAALIGGLQVALSGCTTARCTPSGTSTRSPPRR